MKLTLSVTNEEMLTLLAKATGAPITHYVITDEKAPSGLFARITSAMRIQFGTDYFTNEATGAFGPANRKIEAIKYLRTLIKGLGLKEAKDAVENWEAWLAFIRINDRVPSSSEIGLLY